MTEVPQHVRHAAKAVFRMHRPGRVLLQRVDQVDEAWQRPDGCSAVFAGDSLRVRVDVVRGEELARLTVRLEPEADAVVELQQPGPELSLVARGRPPLHLDAATGRLARLLITADGGTAAERSWQTAWTSL